MDIEFVNPNSHSVQLAGPDRKTITIGAGKKIVLPQYFKKYCPKYLRIIKMTNDSPVSEGRKVPDVISLQKPHKPKFSNKRKSRAKTSEDNRPRPKLTPVVTKTRSRNLAQVKSGRSHPRQTVRRRNVSQSKVVGRQAASRADADKYFKNKVSNTEIPISNNIGIGILSYNRPFQLARLLNSITKFTDLGRTTVFVSDESGDNPDIDRILKVNNNIINIKSKKCGVAGNSNKLLACLERFEHKILLNDDVEIISRGWETFYPEVAKVTGLHHFCYRQNGLYNANRNEGEIKKFNGKSIQIIDEKPHGAVMYLDHATFEKVGYFDENFGEYGLEHVDYSNRVSLSGIQNPAFCDALGSEKFFVIHKESSAVESRSQELTASRKYFDKVKNQKSRVYVDCKQSTIKDIPKISYVIPYRDTGRANAIKIVAANVKAQRFPIIDIVMAEEDNKSKINQCGYPSKHILSKCSKGKDFCKAAAFNLGVESTLYDTIILHDADMLIHGSYTSTMHKLLQSFDGVHIGKNVLYLSRTATDKVITTYKIDRSLDAERMVGYYEGGSLGVKKSAYVKVGGFNEDYVGYGMEDCDFFHRMLDFTNFYNERSIDLFHMHHGRTTGWEDAHKRNKAIHERLTRQYKGEEIITHLNLKLKKKYSFK